MPKRKRDNEIVKYRYDNEIEKYRYKIHKRYINEILAKETAKIIRYSFIYKDWEPNVELLKIGYNDIKKKYKELKNFQTDNEIFDKILSAYDIHNSIDKYSSFNRCNEIMKRFLQKYNLSNNIHHGLSRYARVSDELDIEWYSENKIKICEKNTIFHKIIGKDTLSGYNYQFLFKKLIQTIMEDNNPKPVILRLGNEYHIFIGLLQWRSESGKEFPKFDLELFDASGQHLVLIHMEKFLKKYLKSYNVKVFQVIRLDLQSLTFDNLCQTWIYFYLKKRLVEKKNHYEILNEIRNNLIFDGNIINELLLFLNELYYNDSMCSYYLKKFRKYLKF